MIVYAKGMFGDLNTSPCQVKNTQEAKSVIAGKMWELCNAMYAIHGRVPAVEFSTIFSEQGLQLASSVIDFPSGDSGYFYIDYEKVKNLARDLIDDNQQGAIMNKGRNMQVYVEWNNRKDHPTTVSDRAEAVRVLSEKMIVIVNDCFAETGVVPSVNYQLTLMERGEQCFAIVSCIHVVYRFWIVYPEPVEMVFNPEKYNLTAFEKRETFAPPEERSMESFDGEATEEATRDGFQQYLAGEV